MNGWEEVGIEVFKAKIRHPRQVLSDCGYLISADKGIQSVY
jgi:hypothetical protein